MLALQVTEGNHSNIEAFLLVKLFSFHFSSV